jgi:hypothetical protein
MRPRPWRTLFLVALVALALSAGCGDDGLDGADHGDPIAVDPVAGEPLGAPEDNSATEVFFNHLQETKYCLEAWVGLDVSEPPPLESFLASGGTNWDPWQEAIEKYGADAIGESCGPRLDLSYWEARVREAEEARAREAEGQGQRPLPPPGRDDFEAFYTFQRGLKACFEAHGFPLPDPPSLESFIASGAANWSPLSQLIDLHPSASHADVWDQLEAECEALGLTFDEFRDS